jgi:hypothetical protein
MLEWKLEVQEVKIYVSILRMVLDLRQEVGAVQERDNDFQEFKRKLLGKEGSEFREDENGTLYFRERI